MTVSRILKPFQVVTTEMSGDKYVTVSKVIMLAHGLSSVCTKIKATVTTQLANELVDTRHALGRLTCTLWRQRKQHDSCHCQPTFIDPRFKKNAFQSANNYSRVKEVVTAEAAKLSDGHLSRRQRRRLQWRIVQLLSVKSSTSTATSKI